MALADSFDSSPAYAFKVTIDGIEIPKVTEVIGLKNEVDKIELKQQPGDGKYVARQLIGRAKTGEFTVTRGLTDSKTITDWLKEVVEGDVAGARKTASVELLDYAGRRSRSTTSATAGCGSSRSTRSRPARPSRRPRSSRSASTSPR